MPQRSFRIPDNALADLGKISEHLATLDRRAPNQTTALVWAISRGIDAIAQSEDDGEQVPENLLEELAAATQQLDALATRWRWAVGFGSSRKAADDDTAAERTSF